MERDQDLNPLEEVTDDDLEEDDMDESVTTHNGAITIHTGSCGTSYRDDDEAVCHPLNPYTLE
ncbi:MAG: hypothetical protein WCF51_06155 [Nitrosomonadaceae bacterium]